MGEGGRDGTGREIEFSVNMRFHAVLSKITATKWLIANLSKLINTNPV